VTGDVVVSDPVSVVFQEPRLVPWKRVWANVSLGLRTGDPRSVARSALDESGYRHAPMRGRSRCPAARPSGRRWPAPWSATLACCCWTSRSARWTR
jgi:hypothetical protein